MTDEPATDTTTTTQDPAAAALPADSLLSATATGSLDFTAGKPADFPDDYWDAEKNTPNVERLYNDFKNRDKIAKDLRVKLSRGEFESKPPEDINEYVVELTDAIKADDPLLTAAKQAAKEAGLPKEAFSKFMQPVIAKVLELAQAQSAEPSEEEIAEIRNAEIAKLGPTGHKIVSAVGAHIDSLTKGGTFSESEASALKASLTNVEVVRAYNKLRMLTGGQDQVPLEMPIDVRASRMDIEQKLGEAMRTGNEAEYLKYSSMLAKMG